MELVVYYDNKNQEIYATSPDLELQLSRVVLNVEKKDNILEKLKEELNK